MAHIAISFDPNSPEDVEAARRAFALHAPTAPQSPPPIQDEELRNRVGMVLQGRSTRGLEYIRMIAEKAPQRARYADIVQAMGGEPKSLGGIHSAIERAWNGAGGTGMFIDTNKAGDSRMDATLAAVVLDVLSEAGLHGEDD